MNGFSVIYKEKREIHEAGKSNILIPALEYFIRPSTYVRGLGSISCTEIRVPIRGEARKLRQAYRIANKASSVVISKDYGMNYSTTFYISMLVRALDLYSMSLGCDLRLNEVVIADAATYEGMSAFRMLLPIARRILLVTERKKELADVVDKAIMDFGISAAVIEDPIKAAEKADAIVLASDSPNHSYLVTKSIPTLVIKYHKLPSYGRWFDNTEICYRDGCLIEEAAVQGYLQTIGKERLWRNAECEGFSIDSIKRQESILLSR